jgi:hypothetical protein
MPVMKLIGFRMRTSIHITRNLVAILCAVLLIPGDTLLNAWPAQTTESAEAAKLPNDQLDSLVAPIALYPDPLLTQTLVASTYPLEIIQLQQWLEKNKSLKGKALTDAVVKQDWDPSIQAMAPFPDLVKQLAENIKWTADLGNAFLAQQGDVMDAVQRMRKKAQDKGNLKTTEQQKVEVKVVENKQVVVIEPASPEVVYVPSYDPTVVYGAAVYAYPPIAYPPAGYYAAGMALSFGVGVAMGAAFSGGWGWNSGWGGNNSVYVNRNNNFVNNSNRQNLQGGNRQNIQGGNRGGSNTWQHNPQHRGGAPYSDRATANKFGGAARGDSMASRQSNARQNQAQRGSGMDRSAGARQQSAAMNRGAGAGASNMSTNRSGGDRIGNRSTSGPSAGSRDTSAFGGGGGSSARASSQRGASSMGGSRSFGGGRAGGGGGRRR